MSSLVLLLGADRELGGATLWVIHKPVTQPQSGCGGGRLGGGRTDEGRREREREVERGEREHVSMEYLVALHPTVS